MKELSEINLPEDVRYTKDHEWARKKGETSQIGITDFAADGVHVFIVRQTVGQHDDVIVATVAVTGHKLAFIMNRRVVGTEIIAGIVKRTGKRTHRAR